MGVRKFYIYFTVFCFHLDWHTVQSYHMYVYVIHKFFVWIFCYVNHWYFIDSFINFQFQDTLLAFNDLYKKNHIYQIAYMSALFNKLLYVHSRRCMILFSHVWSEPSLHLSVLSTSMVSPIRKWGGEGGLMYILWPLNRVEYLSFLTCLFSLSVVNRYYIFGLTSLLECFCF